MKRRHSIVFMILTAGVLSLWGCDVDLSVPPAFQAPRLEVQVELIDYHEGVQGTWAGTLEHPNTADVPSGVEGAHEAQVQLGYHSRVLQGETLNFPVSAPLYPGEWSIHFTVADEAGTIMDFTCDFNLPALFGGAVIGLKIIEGSEGCTSQTGGVSAPSVPAESHDVEAVTLSAPAAADVGVPVQVTTSVKNNGNVPESFVLVRLAAQPPTGGPLALGTQVTSLDINETKDVGFDWDTACVEAGDYTLTATASASNDGDASNDEATASLALALDRELSIAFVNPPATVPPGQSVSLIARLANNNSIQEQSVDVTFTDTPASGPEGTRVADPRLPIDVGCGETVELIFTWVSPSIGAADHDLTLSIGNSIPGDDPADNSDTITISVQ